jgi:peptidoglycan/xylan/chitin deacetylase (PgdA/CDA1 family)
MTNVSGIILTFHGVGSLTHFGEIAKDAAAIRYILSVEQFENILSMIDCAKCCTVEEFCRITCGDWRLITFDDGYITDYEVVLPILLRYNLRGTFFVTAENIGQNGFTSIAQLREMVALGMEIGSHGFTHQYLTTRSRDEVIREIHTSKKRIEDEIGVETTSFAPVGGHYERWMLDVAADAGYRVFATMIPGQSMNRTEQGKNILLLKRNHIQRHHDLNHVTGLLQGKWSTLWTNHLRYSLLQLPKSLLGLTNYDRMKALVLGK